MSLIEITIASVILFIVSAAIYLILFNGSVFYTNQTRLGDIQERARRVLDEMANELRMADRNPLFLTITQNPAGTPDTVSFRVPTGYIAATKTITWSGIITYGVELSTLDANNNAVQDEGRIFRTEGGVKRILTDYVTTDGLKIVRTAVGNDLILKVTLTFLIADAWNKPIRTTLETSVTLRNQS